MACVACFANDLVVAGQPHGQPLPSSVVVGAADNATMQIWDFSTGELLRVIADVDATVSAVEVIAEDVCISGSEMGEIRVWDLHTGECRHLLDGHSDTVHAFAVLEDGLVASGAKDELIQIWDPEAGKLRRTLKGHKGGVLALAPLGYGLVASGSTDKAIRVWMASSGSCIAELEGHAGAVQALAALERRWLASGCSAGEVRVWDPEKGGCLHVLGGGSRWRAPHSGAVWDMATLAGTTFASICHKRLCVWDARRAQLVHRISLGVHLFSTARAVVSLGDAGFAATVGKTLSIFSKEGERLRTLGSGRASITALAAPAHASALAGLLCEASQQARTMLSTSHIDLVAAARLLQWRCRGGALAELEQAAIAQAAEKLCYCTSICVAYDCEVKLFYGVFHPELLEKSSPREGGWSNGDDFTPRVRTARAQCWVGVACEPDAAVAPLWFFAGFLGNEELLSMASEATQTCLKTLTRARLNWAIRARKVEALRYALVLAKHLRCMDTDEFLRAARLLGEVAELPSSWDVGVMVRAPGDRLAAKVAVPRAEEGLPHGNSRWEGLQRALADTFIHLAPQNALQLAQRQDAKGLRLLHAYSIQNEIVWKRYREKQEQLRQADLSGSLALDDIKTGSAATHLQDTDTTLREYWLWHGTTHESAESIVFQDFHTSLAGSHSGTAYGPGIYFTEYSSRADVYTRADHRSTRVMFLCRVTLGRILHKRSAVPNPTRLLDEVASGGFHSVLGDRSSQGVPREVVIYDSDQVYPAYLVVYKRSNTA